MANCLTIAVTESGGGGGGDCNQCIPGDARCVDHLYSICSNGGCWIETGQSCNPPAPEAPVVPPLEELMKYAPWIVGGVVVLAILGFATSQRD